MKCKQVPVEARNVVVAKLHAGNGVRATEQHAGLVTAQRALAARVRELDRELDVAEGGCGGGVQPEHVTGRQLDEAQRLRRDADLGQALAVVERRERVADAEAGPHRVPGVEEKVARVVRQRQAPRDLIPGLRHAAGAEPEVGVDARQIEPAEQVAVERVLVGLAPEVPEVGAPRADVRLLVVIRGQQEGVAEIVLRLEQERRLEVGRQRRDVEQRAEPFVEQPPARRAAVVVARIVRRAQRAERGLDQPLARIDLDRLEPGGEIDHEPMRGGRVVPAQGVRARRPVDDGDLDRLTNQLPLAPDVDLDVVAARNAPT